MAKEIKYEVKQWIKGPFKMFQLEKMENFAALYRKDKFFGG